MPPKKPQRGNKRDSGRRGGKKKISILNTEQISYIDWKDVDLLRRFVSDRAKIRARRVTGNNARQQREMALAVKNARELALLPYASRVTQQRGGGRRGDRDSAAGPPPRPDVPPPTRRDEEPADAESSTDEAPVTTADAGESGGGS